MPATLKTTATALGTTGTTYPAVTPDFDGFAVSHPWIGQKIGKPLPIKGGFAQQFRAATVYGEFGGSPMEVHGAIRDKYLLFNGPEGFLGFPTTNETATPDGKGRFNHFEHGSIYWHPSTGAFEVHGSIRDKWASLGWENGFLGYPITDERDLGVNGGRFSNFQHGQIAWSPSSGVAVSAASKVPGSNGGIRPKGVDGNGNPEVRRVVVASAHIDITDDETFGSNEHAAANKQDQGFVSFGQPQALLSIVGKAGGEVRVELEVNASATIEGDVQISGTAKLFEGTSEETDDLDGTTDINFTVPRDNFIQKNLTVRNTDEGGDFADIRLTISNHAA